MTPAEEAQMFDDIEQDRKMSEARLRDLVAEVYDAVIKERENSLRICDMYERLLQVQDNTINRLQEYITKLEAQIAEKNVQATCKSL
jgi:L-lactate utilization protein LutB